MTDKTNTTHTTDKKSALVAMSGGVDSSVAAHLTKQAGYDISGVTLKMFTDNSGDVSDARSACQRLGIKHYFFDYSETFKSEVIGRFISAYENGLTPNPCIDCNRHIKFGRLFDKAEELCFDKIVTGHYAVTEYDVQSGRYLLKKARDISKDQSYVLYSLGQKQLAKAFFPLGEYTKAQAREIADSLGLINARKHDSQDICFVPDGSYAAFIESYSGKTYPCGEFVSTSGEVLGEHKGIIRYTVGQRKGLGLALPHPMYVMQKDVKNNRVILCDNNELFSRELVVTDINLITCEKLSKPVKLKARVRYNQPEKPATAEQIDENTLRIVFDEPQRAISRGQAAVLYDGEYVVGGGTIV